MMNPIPPINQVLAMLMQDETRKQIGASITDAPTETSQAFSVQAYMNKSKQGKIDKPLCANCGLPRHVKDKCYKLHGYPRGTH